jgi:hypothetical protein
MVTAKEIVDYAEIQLDVFSILTPETLAQTVGGLNGMDMETYNKGYVDALRQLVNHFETRV